jgi:hypothetical protein
MSGKRGAGVAAFGLQIAQVGSAAKGLVDFSADLTGANAATFRGHWPTVAEISYGTLKASK